MTRFCAYMNCKRFQSTHSRGVRPYAMVLSATTIYNFNPRTHEECDHICRVLRWRYLISIHSLTRSATYRLFAGRRVDFISIHALTRSATHNVRRATGRFCNFNPRTHEECDSKELCLCDRAGKISIHALTRSATLVVRLQRSPQGISIHALTRSAT